MRYGHDNEVTTDGTIADQAERNDPDAYVEDTGELAGISILSVGHHAIGHYVSGAIIGII